MFVPRRVLLHTQLFAKLAITAPQDQSMLHLIHVAQALISTEPTATVPATVLLVLNHMPVVGALLVRAAPIQWSLAQPVTIVLRLQEEPVTISALRAHTRHPLHCIRVPSALNVLQDHIVLGVILLSLERVLLAFIALQVLPGLQLILVQQVHTQPVLGWLIPRAVHHVRPGIFVSVAHQAQHNAVLEPTPVQLAQNQTAMICIILAGLPLLFQHVQLARRALIAAQVLLSVQLAP